LESLGGRGVELGEKGLNISGGQKARVSLARAVYQDRDIYLLDDVLSAVDVHVGQKLIQRCLLGHLQHKTRLLVTHNLSVCKHADLILMLREGRIVEQGVFADMRDKPCFGSSYAAYMEKGDHEEGEEEPLRLARGESKERGPVRDEKTKITVEEDRYRNAVPLSTYLNYLRVNGGVLFVGSIVLLMAAGTYLQFYSSILIIQWCQEPTQSRYLVLYLLSAVLIGLCYGGRGLILVVSTLRQGRWIFSRMVGCLLRSSMGWWNSQPSGIIINRLTKDVTEIDEQLASLMGSYLVAIFQLLVSVLVCVFDSSFLVLVPFALLMGITGYMRTFYMKTQRELTRLAAITRSPILSLFKETIEGLHVLRAMNKEAFASRGMLQAVDLNVRTSICSSIAESWFKTLTTSLSFFFSATAVGLTIFGSIDGAYMGLLLTYIFNLSDWVSGYVMSSAYIENKMISFERCLHFTDLPLEIGLTSFTLRREAEPLFPQGRIEFRSMGMRYREDLPLVLKSLDCLIQAGEKIGIVGRTGAGKSSLAQVLLRLVEVSQGQVLIDGKDISQVQAKDLRNEITFVAQEPILYHGTLRENIDPSMAHSDE
jgi:ABC-type multidrug transport system fused ATPase/permease subunit